MKYKSFKQFINEASIPRVNFSREFIQPFNNIEEAYQKVSEEYQNYVNFCNEAIQRVAKNRAKLAIRIKRQETVIEKLKRKGKPLNQIMDILAGTIVAENQDLANKIAKYIWNAHRDKIFSFETKIDTSIPDRTGYSVDSGAYHLNLDLNGLGVEILIMSKKTSELKKVAHKIYQVQRQGGEADKSQVALVARRFKQIRRCQENPESCRQNKRKVPSRSSQRNPIQSENSFLNFIENKIKEKFADVDIEKFLPLKEEYGLYFNLDKDTKLIPLNKLIPTRAREEGIRNALIYMISASRGEHSKRDPISIKQVGDMYEINDGNSTFNVAKKSNWKYMPAKIVN